MLIFEPSLSIETGRTGLGIEQTSVGSNLGLIQSILWNLYFSWFEYWNEFLFLFLFWNKLKWVSSYNILSIWLVLQQEIESTKCVLIVKSVLLVTGWPRWSTRWPGQHAIRHVIRRCMSELEVCKPATRNDLTCYTQWHDTQHDPTHTFATARQLVWSLTQGTKVGGGRREERKERSLAFESPY